jgi:hypothetical protein
MTQKANRVAGTIHPPKFIRKLGVRGKLMLISTFIITLLFAVLVVLSSNGITHATTDLELGALRQNVSGTAKMMPAYVLPDDITESLQTKDTTSDAYGFLAGAVVGTADVNPQVDDAFLNVYDPTTNQYTRVVLGCGQRTLKSLCHGDPEYYGLGETPPVSDSEKLAVQQFSQPPQDPDVFLSGVMTDAIGPYMIGYAPVRDDNGKMVAYVGVQMRAPELADVQSQIRDTAFKTFLIVYPLSLLVVFIFASALTRPLVHFINAARVVASGAPYDPALLAEEIPMLDERGEMARVFDRMAREVQSRETKLKQEVVQLKIEIDRSKQQQAVEEITESNFFNELQAKARALRDVEQPPAVDKGAAGASDKVASD